SRFRKDIFEFESCEASMTMIEQENLNSIGLMWGVKKLRGKGQLPTFIYSNVTVKYNDQQAVSVLNDLKNNNGDISTYEGGTAIIKLKNVKHSVSTKPILKALRGKPQYVHLK